MQETQLHLTESDGELLRTLARQLGKTDGEIIREALLVLKDRLGSQNEGRRASLRRAMGIWKDRDDLPTLDVLRGELNRTFEGRGG
jgi:hypothetical protein